MTFVKPGKFKVREILGLSHLSSAKIIAGHKGLDRVIKHVTVIDTPGPYKWIRGNELVLSAAYFLKNEPEIQYKIIPDLAQLNVAAIAMKLGRYVNNMPQTMIDHANKYSLPLIELPYEIAWIDIINPIMTEILHRQASIMKKSRQSYERLMNLVLDGCGFPEIASELSSLIDCQVMITDQRWNSIALSPGSHHTDIYPKDLSSFSQEYLKQAWYNGTIPIDSEFINLKISNNLIIVPVIVKEEVHAYIIVPKCDKTLDTLNLTIIDDASTICAVEILRIKASQETQRSFRNDFVLHLISEDFNSIYTMNWRAKAFNWNLFNPHVVLNIKINDTQAHCKERDLAKDKSNLQQETSIQIIESISDADAGCRKLVGVDRNNYIIMLLSFDKDIEPSLARTRTIRLAKRIHSEIKCRLNLTSVSIGISNMVSSAHNVHKAYKQAIRAMALGQKIFNHGRITHFDELGVFQIVCEDLDTEVYRLFHEEWIKPIVEYDKKSGINLIETLNTYFLCNMNIIESAKRLFIHENTFRYRINKIESILGKKLSSGETMLNLWLALKMYLTVASVDFRDRNREDTSSK
ncbi:MAG: hypothetical protein GX977_15050 [Firmicutes bacterium]|nr:hypothetical protein [Bacillota bacterium]